MPRPRVMTFFVVLVPAGVAPRAWGRQNRDKYGFEFDGEPPRTRGELMVWPSDLQPRRLFSRLRDGGVKVRPGLHRCAECAQQFTVTVGTVCEDSHIPLNKWLIAFYMMCASKTQVSALQLQRQLELGSYRQMLVEEYQAAVAATEPNWRPA